MKSCEFGDFLFEGKNPDFKLYSEIEDKVFSLSESNFNEILNFILNLSDRDKTYAIECCNYFHSIKFLNKQLFIDLLEKINEKYKVENNEDDDTVYPDDDLKWIYVEKKESDTIEQLKAAIFSDDTEKLAFLTAEQKISELKINNHSLVEFTCLCGSIKCFKYMLVNGADVSHCGKAAVYGGNEEICALLSEYKCSFDDCLIVAFKAHQNYIAQWLMDNYEVERKYDLNEVVRSFNTLAFLFLTKDGIDEFYLKSKKNALPILSLRVRPPQPKDNIIATAARVSNIPVIEYLIENGCNINSVGNSMFSPLQIASMRGNVELVKLLIAKNADIEYNENTSLTPLMLSKNINILKTLVEAGANINAVNRINKTVLDVILIKEQNLPSEQQEMANYLKQKGAKQA